MALAAALLFGAGAPAAKRLLLATTPQLMAGLLYLGASTGLLLYWLGRRRVREVPEAPLGRRDLPWLCAAIVGGGIVGPLLLMAGLTRTPASAASLLLNLEAVFTAGLAWVVLREHVHRRIVLGMVAIVAGGVLLSWQGHLAWGSIAGPVAVAGACLAWAVDNNLTQKISASDPVQITWLKGLVAGATNTGLAFLLDAQWPAAPVLRYLQHAPESHFAQDAALVAESLSGARDTEAQAAAELLRAGIRPA